MDPTTGASVSSNAAKDFGTFRGNVNSQDLAGETAKNRIDIRESWLEQKLVMDFLFSPLRNTNDIMLCFSSPNEFDHDISAQPMTLDSANEQFCTTNWRNGVLVYSFNLTKEDLARGQLRIGVNGYPSRELADELVLFSWEPVRLRSFKLVDLIYWPFAICVYTLFSLPILFARFCLIYMGLRTPDSPNILLQKWLYKLGQSRTD